MGFLEYIERIREKPESSRRRMAIVATVLVVMIVAVIWATLTFSLSDRFEEKSNIASPFSVIKDIFK